MRASAAIILALLLGACRGEPVPRDYQNAPPAMTHPPTSSAQTPSAHGMPNAAPEPTSGVEGKTVKPVNPIPPTVTLADQAAATTGTTQTTATAATGTHLATPP